METEEDKELMMMRLETLKTMVGKLERKKTKSAVPVASKPTTTTTTTIVPSILTQQRSSARHPSKDALKFNSMTYHKNDQYSLHATNKHKYIKSFKNSNAGSQAAVNFNTAWSRPTQPNLPTISKTFTKVTTSNHASSLSSTRPNLPTVSKTFTQMDNQSTFNKLHSLATRPNLPTVSAGLSASSELHSLATRPNLPTVSKTFTKTTAGLSASSKLHSLPTQPHLPTVSEIFTKTTGESASSKAPIHVASTHKLIRKKPSQAIPHHSQYIYNKTSPTANESITKTFQKTHFNPEDSAFRKKLQNQRSSTFERTHFISKETNINNSASSSMKSSMGNSLQTKVIHKYSVSNVNKLDFRKPKISTTHLKHSKNRYKVNNFSTPSQQWSNNSGSKWHAKSYPTIITRRKSTENRFKISKVPIISVSRNKLIRKMTTPRNNSFYLRRSSYLKHSIQSKPRPPKHYQPTATDSSSTSSTKEMLLSRHGSKYLVSGNMKSLRRLRKSLDSERIAPKKKKAHVHHQNINKFKFQRMTSVNKTRKITSKQMVASNVLKRSRILTLAQRRKTNKTKYCLFYNRFGKCKRGDECPFIHDPSKVAVCTRFLRGTCKDEKCLFSHQVDPSKMPVCSYFLSGQCTKENCPYRHVNVNQDADVCQDFLNGYCALDDKCKKKHVLECHEFIKTGKCSKEKSCKLYHDVRRRHTRKRKSSTSGFRKPKGFTAKVVVDEIGTDKTSGTETMSPLKNKANSNLLPKFISDKLTKDTHEATRAINFSEVRSQGYFISSSATTSEIEMSENDERHPTDKQPTRRVTDGFIPLTMGSSSEGEDSDYEEVEEKVNVGNFSMTEKDFISLE